MGKFTTVNTVIDAITSTAIILATGAITGHVLAEVLNTSGEENPFNLTLAENQVEGSHEGGWDGSDDNGDVGEG